MSKSNLVSLGKFLIAFGIAVAVSLYSGRKSNMAYLAVTAQDKARIQSGVDAIEQAASFQVASFDSFLQSTSNDADKAKLAVSRISSVIESGFRQTSTEVDEACLKSLFQLAAEFLYYRFVLADHSEYVNWRLAGGYRFRDREDLYDKALVGVDHEVLFGTPLAEDAPLRETFVLFADYHRKNWGRTHTPKALAMDPESVMVLVRKVNPVVGEETVTLGSEALDAYWLEPPMASHRNWFEADSDYGFDSYRSGIIGLTLEFGDDKRRTILVGFQSPQHSCRWKISGISVLTLDPSGGLIDY